MRITSLLLLFMFAPAAPAQEVIVPQDSMRDAWSEEQQQFDSLSSEYGTYPDDSYGYSSLEEDNGVDRRTEPDYGRRRGENDSRVTDDGYQSDSELY